MALNFSARSADGSIKITDKPTKRLPIINFKGKPHFTLTAQSPMYLYEGQKQSSDFEAKQWEPLAHGIRAIFAGSQQQTCSLTGLYKKCEALVRCRLATNTYAKIVAVCEECIQEHYHDKMDALINPPLSATADFNSDAKWETEKSLVDLEAVQVLWSQFDGQVSLLSDVLAYIDRVYVLGRQELLSIRNLCMKYFLLGCCHSSSIPRIIAAICHQINLDRESTDTPKNIIRLSCKMLNDLGCIEGGEPSFDYAISVMSKDWFTGKATNKLDEMNWMASPYLFYTIKRLDHEQSLYRAYGFSNLLQTKLKTIVQTCLFTNPINELLNRQMSHLLSFPDNSALKHLFQLASDAGILTDCIYGHWCRAIKEIGQSIFRTGSMIHHSPPLPNSPTITMAAMDIGNAQSATPAARTTTNVSKNDPIKILEQLILLHGNLSVIVNECIQQQYSSLFKDGIKESFESFINMREMNAATILAIYTDHLLRLTTQSADQLHSKLQDAFNIFRYVQRKDEFESAYKQLLAKRLLLNRSAALESELLFVGWLRDDCGCAYSGRLESMIADIKQSVQLMQNYAKTTEGVGKQLKFNVSVIKMGIWPYSAPLTIKNTEKTSSHNKSKGKGDIKSCSLKIPAAIKKEQEAFSQQYLQAHSNRRLQWNNYLGTVHLRMHCRPTTSEGFASPIDLEVTPIHALILSLFNEDAREDGLCVDDVPAMIGCVEGGGGGEIVQVSIAGLVKIGLLQQEEQKEERLIKLNKSFKSKHHKIRLTTSSFSPSDHPSLLTLAPISPLSTAINSINSHADQAHLQLQVDAAIMRTLKHVKECSRDALFTRIQEMMIGNGPHFGRGLFSERVAVLIEKEFIGVDQSAADLSMLRYIS